MQIFHPLQRALSRFRRGEAGGLSIESILTLPTLAWALLACFSYFDGLRQYNINIKAAHTMGDLLSRETQVVDDDYIDGMHDVLKFLTRSAAEPRMRISVVAYDGDDDSFELIWSEARGGQAALTEAGLKSIEGRLPMAFGGSQLIVVETSIDHKAPFVFGLSDRTLDNFLVTRLRFVPQLNHEDHMEGNTGTS
ncbi:hypothetical protein SAMN04488012_11236 [Palleronia salina]|uniref:TadE-like protein n=1 Tax=Palleronia salina TaxID=313368 RepID=A0A1M6KK49_9RHOB|nr:hypothetical protein [Palleronia salina]SHJ59333.1 hypothetical protein SAMN04488012_11236 [Palleronia salina]